MAQRKASPRARSVALPASHDVPGTGHKRTVHGSVFDFGQVEEVTPIPPLSAKARSSVPITSIISPRPPTNYVKPQAPSDPQVPVNQRRAGRSRSQVKSAVVDSTGSISKSALPHLTRDPIFADWFSLRPKSAPDNQFANYVKTIRGKDQSPQETSPRVAQTVFNDAPVFLTEDPDELNHESRYELNHMPYADFETLQKRSQSARLDRRVHYEDNSLDAQGGGVDIDTDISQLSGQWARGRSSAAAVSYRQLPDSARSSPMRRYPFTAMNVRDEELEHRVTQRQNESLRQHLSRGPSRVSNSASHFDPSMLVYAKDVQRIYRSAVQNQQQPQQYNQPQRSQSSLAPTSDESPLAITYEADTTIEPSDKVNERHRLAESQAFQQRAPSVQDLSRNTRMKKGAGSLPNRPNSSPPNNKAKMNNTNLPRKERPHTGTRRMSQIGENRADGSIDDSELSKLDDMLSTTLMKTNTKEATKIYEQFLIDLGLKAYDEFNPEPGTESDQSIDTNNNNNSNDYGNGLSGQQQRSPLELAFDPAAFLHFPQANIESISSSFYQSLTGKKRPEFGRSDEDDPSLELETDSAQRALQQLDVWLHKITDATEIYSTTLADVAREVSYSSRTCGDLLTRIRTEQDSYLRILLKTVETSRQLLIRNQIALAERHKTDRFYIASLEAEVEMLHKKMAYVKDLWGVSNGTVNNSHVNNNINVNININNGGTRPNEGGNTLLDMDNTSVFTNEFGSPNPIRKFGAWEVVSVQDSIQLRNGVEYLSQISSGLHLYFIDLPKGCATCFVKIVLKESLVSQVNQVHKEQSRAEGTAQDKREIKQHYEELLSRDAPAAVADTDSTDNWGLTLYMRHGDPPTKNAYGAWVDADTLHTVSVVELGEDSIVPGRWFFKVAGSKGGPREKRYSITVNYQTDETRSLLVSEWVDKMEADAELQDFYLEEPPQVEHELIQEVTRRKDTIPKLIQNIKENVKPPRQSISIQTDKSFVQKCLQLRGRGRLYENEHTQLTTDASGLILGDFKPYLPSMALIRGNSGTSGTNRLLPANIAMEILYRIFEEKAIVDRVDLAANRPPQSMADFTYHYFFLRRYGAGSLARSQLSSLIRTLFYFYEQHPTQKSFRMTFFGRITSLFSNESSLYRSELESFYIKTLEVLKNITHPDFGEIRRNPLTGGRTLTVSRAMAVTERLLGGDPARAHYYRDVTNQIKQIAISGNGKDLDFDQFMEIMVQEWEIYYSHVLSSTNQILHKSRIIHEGLMTFRQFYNSISTICSAVTQRECLKLYQEVLEASQSDLHIKAKAFAMIVHKYQLFKRQQLHHERESDRERSKIEMRKLTNGRNSPSRSKSPSRNNNNNAKQQEPVSSGLLTSALYPIIDSNWIDPNPMHVEAGLDLNVELLNDAWQGVLEMCAEEVMYSNQQSDSQVIIVPSEEDRKEKDRIENERKESQLPKDPKSIHDFDPLIYHRDPDPVIMLRDLRSEILDADHQIRHVELNRESLDRAWIAVESISKRIALERTLRLLEREDLERPTPRETQIRLRQSAEVFVRKLEKSFVQLLGHGESSISRVGKYRSGLDEIREMVFSIISDFENRFLEAVKVDFYNRQSTQSAVKDANSKTAL